MTMVGIADIVFVIAGWLIGNVIFRNFERHAPLWRRIVKFSVLLAVLIGIGVLGGRPAFYLALAALALGMMLLHLWWFPKHGIHWRTAEPRDRYLELIGRMKGRR